MYLFYQKEYHNNKISLPMPESNLGPLAPQSGALPLGNDSAERIHCSQANLQFQRYGSKHKWTKPYLRAFNKAIFL